MTVTQSQLALVSDAIATGRIVSGRIRDSAAAIGHLFPVKGADIAAFERSTLLETDSLLLQFNNLVAIIQDQLIRGILALEEEPTVRLSRLDQRHLAEKLGALPAGLDLGRVIHARNRIAHQYPNAPDKQAALLNEVWAAVPDLLEAYAGLSLYIEGRYFRQNDT